MEHGALEIELRDQAETQALAQRFAAALKPGQSILLTGDLGTGKTTFARSFIQHRFGQLIEVPSPTFTLVQTYDHPVHLQHHGAGRLASIKGLPLELVNND